MILVICTSPNEQSVSRLTANFVCETLRNTGASVKYHDVIDLPPIWIQKGGVDILPDSWRDIYADAEKAEGVVLIGPIYYYSAGSPTNIVVEALGTTLQWKPLLLLGAAGSLRSHLANGSLMQNLIYERNVFIYPNSALVTAGDLLENGQPSEEMSERLKAVAEGFTQFTTRLSDIQASE